MVLYNEVNKYLQESLETKSSKAFNVYMESSEVLFGGLFVSVKYIPLLDKIDSAEYKDGYLKHRDKFWKVYETVKTVNNISESDNYISLLKVYERNPYTYVLDVVKDKLNDKIVSLDYPIDSELAEIEIFNTSDMGDQLKKLIFEKFYLFERLV